MVMCYMTVNDPDYLKVERDKLIRQKQGFDTLGLCLLAATMASWEIVLSKGQEWDWFGDPFWRVQTLAAIFVTGLAGLIIRETRIKNPLINFRTLKDRNFRACCIVIACTFGVLYANTTTLPGLLQSLFGYDATTSGLVLSPSGIGAILALIVVGRLLGKGLDARYLMATGLVLMSAGNFWMSRMNLDISPWDVVWPRVVLIIGLSMMFAPLNVAAFMRIPKELRGAAVGLLALLRNEGGSVGTSVAQTIQERREQFHTLRLNESLNVFNPAVNQLLVSGKAFYLQHSGNLVAAQQLTINSLAHAGSAGGVFGVF